MKLEEALEQVKSSASPAEPTVITLTEDEDVAENANTSAKEVEVDRSSTSESAGAPTKGTATKTPAAKIAAGKKTPGATAKQVPSITGFFKKLEENIKVPESRESEVVVDGSSDCSTTQIMSGISGSVSPSVGMIAEKMNSSTAAAPAPAPIIET